MVSDVSKLIKKNRKGCKWVALCDGVSLYHETFASAYVDVLKRTAEAWSDGVFPEVTICGLVPQGEEFDRSRVK